MDLSRFTPARDDTPEDPRPTDRFPRWWWSRLELSPSTHRSFGHTAPRTRGWSHLVMTFVWPVLVVLLLQRADGVRAVVGALVFGLGMQVMFTASAVTHLRRWGVWTTEVLFRLDHTGIFLAIAGGVTPFLLLVVGGWMGTAMLVVAWVVTLGGIGFTLWPARTPVGFGNATFITIGALMLPFLPLAWDRIGPTGVALLVGGGVVYVVGAIMLAHQWPPLRPLVFGYHEVWHAMVVVAAMVHYVMIREYILPLA